MKAFIIKLPHYTKEQIQSNLNKVAEYNFGKSQIKKN